MLRCLNSIIKDGTEAQFFGKIPFVVDDNIWLAIKLDTGEPFDMFLNNVFYYLRKNNQEFLESGEVLFRYRKYTFEEAMSPEGVLDMFFAKTDDMLLRTKDPVLLDSFTTAYRQTEKEKREFMKGVIAVLKDNESNLFDPKKAKKAIKKYLNIDLQIPLGPNGLAPDYSTIKDTVVKGNKLIYHYGAKPGIVKIKYSSILDTDFSLANKELGLSSEEISEVEKLYVWHHLDDFDPVTGEGTLQLVLRELHNPAQKGYGEALRHTGGAAMWRYFYFPYASDILNYEL